MNHKLISVLICLLFLVCASMPFVVAETGEGWGDAGEGFDATPTPSATSSVYQSHLDAVFTNMYIAFGLVGVALILVACFIILHSSSGEGVGSGVLLGVFLLISGVVALVVGFAVVIGFENSVSVISLLY